MQFTYEKPTVSGHYLCNKGDVVTDESLFYSHFKESEGILVDQSGTPALAYYKSIKFLKIDTGKLNKLGCE